MVFRLLKAFKTPQHRYSHGGKPLFETIRLQITDLSILHQTSSIAIAQQLLPATRYQLNGVAPRILDERSILPKNAYRLGHLLPTILHHLLAQSIHIRHRHRDVEKTPTTKLPPGIEVCLPARLDVRLYELEQLETDAVARTEVRDLDLPQRRWTDLEDRSVWVDGAVLAHDRPQFR